MRKIKCSRCHHYRLVDDNYRYKECPRCHERTVKRISKIKTYPTTPKFDAREIFSFPSWREFVATQKRWFKRKHFNKETLEKLRKEYKFRKEQFFKDNEAKLEKLAEIFHTREYPIKSKECLDVRQMVLERFHEGKEWDVFKWNSHVSSCESCNMFTVACKRGDFYVESPIEPQKEEGYCSLEEWKANMDVFREASNTEDPIDRAERKAYPNLKSCCPNCGTQLINDKCPKCQQD